MTDKHPLGSFMLVLHTHLPYVLCHGRTPHGTDWLSEAAAECYVPLLDALYDLVEEGVSPRITIGITPVLTEMLADPIFVYEFTSYLQDKMLAAKRDRAAFQASGQAHLASLAEFWHDRYARVFRNFRIRYGKSITSAFKQLQDEGHIEIITSEATHGYMPLLSQDTSLQAQVKQGVRDLPAALRRGARKGSGSRNARTGPGIAGVIRSRLTAHRPARICARESRNFWARTA